MATPKVFESEYRFCQILWEHEPGEQHKACSALQGEAGVV